MVKKQKITVPNSTSKYTLNNYNDISGILLEIYKKYKDNLDSISAYFEITYSVDDYYGNSEEGEIVVSIERDETDEEANKRIEKAKRAKIKEEKLQKERVKKNKEAEKIKLEKKKARVLKQAQELGLI